MTTFVKEFEDYVLSDFSEDKLESIIPGSESELYIKILKQIKGIEDKIPLGLEDDLEKFNHHFGRRKIDTLWAIKLLKEFDLKTTNEDRRKAIVSELKNFSGLSYLDFDHRRPNTFQATKGGDINGDEEKYASKLDPDFLNVDLYVKNSNEYANFDRRILTNLLKNEYLDSKFFDYWLVEGRIDFPLDDVNDSFVLQIAATVNSLYDQKKTLPNIPASINTLPLNQLELLLKTLKTLRIDLPRNYLDKTF